MDLRLTDHAVRPDPSPEPTALLRRGHAQRSVDPLDVTNLNVSPLDPQDSAQVLATRQGEEVLNIFQIDVIQKRE